ncbi:hypothetical protein [Marinobacter xestospongiae]|uniref:hypothetical protein n=1 Tax=Marinobacter xestospongiae TaxID=994319 RepID=UPI002003D3FC|nr:hypothetical protein [Marinobacter xestospongiae]MCK7566708.1 hypothetical protein [Marinobacter xestospongiae]
MAVPENSTVRWFTSEMAGAPQLTHDPGSVIAILDACLLHGFGQTTPDGNKIIVSAGVATVEFSGGNTFERHAVVEISGATPNSLNDVWRISSSTATTFTFDCPDVPDGIASGAISVKRATPGYWEKAFGGDMVAAYRSTHPNGTGMYLRIDDSRPFSDEFRIPVRGYMSMTDIDTGVGEFPTFDSRPEDDSSSTHLWIRHSTQSQDDIPAPWAVIADERFIWYLPNVRQKNGAALYQFGDVGAPATADVYNCVLTGHYRNAWYGTDGSHALYVGSNYKNGCYFAGSHDGSKTGVSYWRSGMGSSPLVYQSNRDVNVYPNPISGGYLFSPLIAYDDETWRGTVPGIKQIDTFLSEDVEFSYDEQFRIIDLGFGLDRPILMLQAGGKYRGDYYMAAAFDIWGPWR